MRGARHVVRHTDVVHGIIPADAGSTEINTTPFTGAQDHPRGCGEHEHGLTVMAGKRGSSPRMRGAHPGDLVDGLLGRIIPADAGSTSSARPFGRDTWDHPRGCGEHKGKRKLLHMREGSSPRMRGAPMLFSYAVALAGIIPADAGSTPG